MKRLFTLMALVMALALAQAADAKGNTAGIGGKWSAQKMQRGKETRDVPQGLSITIEFAPRGKFKATLVKTDQGKSKSDVQDGKWDVKGDALTTVVREKKEEMKFLVQGDTLILIKIGKDEKLFLKRVK